MESEKQGIKLEMQYLKQKLESKKLLADLEGKSLQPLRHVISNG
jgi:hypothetical protein